MDATSRRICLTGVLKMNSSRFLFLHSPHSPSSLFSFIRAQLSPPLLSSTRKETNGRTVTALVNDIDRHCLPGSSRCVNEKRFFSTSNAPIVLFPFLVSPPPPIFFLLFLRRNVWSGSWNGCAEKWRLETEIATCTL